MYMHTETKQYTYNIHPKKQQNNQINERQQQNKQNTESSLLHRSADGQCIALLNGNSQSLGKMAIGHVIMSKGSYS